MKSTIRIDVDHDNQPIIKIKYEQSDDIKDKLVKNFLDTFGGESSWATFRFDPYVVPINSEAVIRPISKYDLPEEVKTMQIEADRQLATRKAIENPAPKTSTENSSSITGTTFGDIAKIAENQESLHKSAGKKSKLNK